MRLKTLSNRQKGKVLRRLYDMVPKMCCLPDCNECCTHVTWSRFEWFSLNEATRFDYDFFKPACDFKKDGRCIIHNDRPLGCRLLGAVEDQRCKKGVRPDALLRKGDAAKITQIYHRIFFKED
jgi:hypothetical protein